MRVFAYLRAYRWWILLGAALVAAGGAGVYYLWPAMSAREMLACLPEGDGPALYVNAGLLRKTGVLDQLAGNPGGEDSDYRGFVAATGFDYRRDLDAALVQWRNGTTLMVLRGRFSDDRLERYALANHGQCARSFCSLPGSVPERRISFQPLGHGAMALATGPDSMGAAAIRQGASTPAFEPPPGPIWLSLPASSFHSQAEMPQWVSLFLESLRGAQRATLTLEVHVDGFEVALNAPCDSNATASEISGRLTTATGVLKGLTEGSSQPQDSANVLAVLAGGTFRADQSAVRGSWRLNRAFFDALGR